MYYCILLYIVLFTLLFFCVEISPARYRQILHQFRTREQTLFIIILLILINYVSLDVFYNNLYKIYILLYIRYNYMYA